MPPLALALNAARLPIIAVVILEVFWYIIEKISFLSFLDGDILFAVKFIIMFSVGWITVALGGKMIDALLAGALLGIAVELVDLILSLIFYPGGFYFGSFFTYLFQWIIIAAAVSGAAFYFITNRYSAR